jgi:hypothetical protein
MPKEMIAIPEGNLLRVAATKSIMTLWCALVKTRAGQYRRSITIARGRKMRPSVTEVSGE